MKKSLVYIVSGITTIVSLFLAYAQLAFKFDSAALEAVVNQVKAGSTIEGMTVTFSEFMDMSSSPQTFASVLSVILVIIALICTATLLVVGIMRMMNKKAVVLKEMNTRIPSIIACSCYAIALLLGLIWPNLPSMAGVYTLKSSIGLGSILVLVAVLANVAGSYLIKEE